MTSKLDNDIAREIAARLTGHQEASPHRYMDFLNAFYLELHREPNKAPEPAVISVMMGYGWKYELDPQLSRWRTEALQAEGFRLVDGKWSRPRRPSIEEAANI